MFSAQPDTTAQRASRTAAYTVGSERPTVASIPFDEPVPSRKSLRGK